MKGNMAATKIYITEYTLVKLSDLANNMHPMTGTTPVVFMEGPVNRTLHMKIKQETFLDLVMVSYLLENKGNRIATNLLVVIAMTIYVLFMLQQLIKKQKIGHSIFSVR